ncbi:MAG: MFS transporter [Acetobacteraceae bacterium]|nr:MFS transporter [Acetobacteraceae bacterium]
MAARSTTLMLLALGTMSVQQTFATIGRGLPPIIAPAIVADLAIDPALLGVYVAIAAASSLLFQLGCGSFILRHGALRVSQAALALVATGLAVSAAGPLVFWALAAVVGAGGSAMSTPASSHLLARYTEARWMPLVFSIKQTAVPLALLISGLLGPFLTGLWGWQGALLATAAACYLFVALMQPLRREFDADRQPGYPVRLGDFATVTAEVLRGGALRNLALASFAFNGLQTVFTSYFVITLTSLGYGLEGAGAMYSLAMVVAVPGRIFWGWLASAHVAPRVLMAWLAIGMAAGAAALGLIGAGWPVWLTALVAIALSATVMSWHGVVLSECVRLAPAGNPGAATGGVLSFGQLGGLILPLVYAGMLGATGNSGIGFLVCGLPGLVVGVMLLRR